MHLSKLYTTKTERIVRLSGMVMGILALMALVAVSDWQHHYIAIHKCDSKLSQYGYDSDCADITGLTHLYAWGLWAGAIMIALGLVLLMVLAVMGLVYFFFGEKLGISEYSDEVNRFLRDDFIGLAITLGAIDGLIIVVYFVASVLMGAYA